jgi:glycosyltransferase involved in cell wall biosynthesis
MRDNPSRLIEENAVPTVSVIIPCFNLGEYLDEAVDSVLAQTFDDFEVLIVDDGSTDPATRELLEGYTRPKTTVFRTPNRKLAAARNFLVSRARGRYLCALDADDKLHPEYLERTVSVLDAEPGLTFVSTHLQMFGEETAVWPSVDRCDLPMLLCDDTVITPALVRRDAVLACGGYDEHMPHQGDEDWHLWMTLVENGHRGVILPDVLFFYRRRPNSMCIQCTTGQVHLDLVGYLARKHAQSYRKHLTEVLLWKDARLREARLANDALETDLQRRLVATVEGRQQEVDLLRHKVETAKLDRAARDAAEAAPRLEAEVDRQRLELAEVRAECSRALTEIDAVRASTSWRVTAPARALRRALRRVRGRRDE